MDAVVCLQGREVVIQCKQIYALGGVLGLGLKGVCPWCLILWAWRAVHGADCVACFGVVCVLHGLTKTQRHCNDILWYAVSGFEQQQQ